MTTKNAARCRAYYERVKQDRVKHQARIAKISENRRRRQAASLAGHVKQSEDPLARSPLMDERNHVKPTPFEAPLATSHVKQPAGKPEAREAPVDLDYEERAAIMEHDGGLSRVEAEFEAALRSTEPLVPVHAPPKEPAAPQGGKHAASQTQGEIELTPEQIIAAWRAAWS